MSPRKRTHKPDQALSPLVTEEISNEAQELHMAIVLGYVPLRGCAWSWRPLKTEVAKSLPIGLGDEQRLTRVLLNLVGNAIKLTDAWEVSITDLFGNGETKAVPPLAPFLHQASPPHRRNRPLRPVRLEYGRVRH
jgi:hypothetical protein